MLLALGMIAFTGCEEDNKEDVNPLVGNWSLSDMQQSAVYVSLYDLASLGKSAGDTLGSGSLTWTEFQAMGVSATVNLKEDNTFLLTGYLPSANDTLGYPPDTVSITDNGIWAVASDLSTLEINGGLYDFNGTLTLDNAEDPDSLSVAYTEIDTEMVVLPIDINGDNIPDMFVDSVFVVNYSSTVLGWTGQ